MLEDRLCFQDTNVAPDILTVVTLQSFTKVKPMYLGQNCLR